MTYNGAGIYCLRNKVNGKKYVGSSAHVENRLLEHISHLERNIHSNRALQEAYNTDGLEFTILEELSEDATYGTILEREQAWIDEYHCLDPNYGYNKINSKVGNQKYKDLTRPKVHGRMSKKGLRILEELIRCDKHLYKLWKLFKILIGG